MNILYLDCFSGISGDMTLAALVDAGADREYIERELKKLAVEPFDLEWKRVVKKGISALQLAVIPDPDHPPVHHRHYADIVKRIGEAGLSERATDMALRIFEKIAVAEAKIHGIPVDRVHFHEVGAVDSIVDAVGVALALDSLQVDKLVSAPVPLGSGMIRIDHGLYPVPAPATLELMKGLPIAVSRHAMELTTPTGAGIVSALVQEFSPGLPDMVIEAIGYGAGTRELPDQPNVLRVVLGRATEYGRRSGYVHGLGQGQEHGQSHDHVHEDGHGHEHDHEHGHIHGHRHDHDHEHSHGAHHHCHGQGQEHDHEHHHDHDKPRGPGRQDCQST